MTFVRGHVFGRPAFPSTGHRVNCDNVIAVIEIVSKGASAYCGFVNRSVSPAFCTPRAEGRAGSHSMVHGTFMSEDSIFDGAREHRVQATYVREPRGS